MPPTLRARSLNHWTAREAPGLIHPRTCLQARLHTLPPTPPHFSFPHSPCNHHSPLSSPALENYSKSVLSTAGLIQVRSSPSGRILSLVISEVYCCYIPLCSPVLSHFCLLLSCFLKHFHFNFSQFSLKKNPFFSLINAALSQLIKIDSTWLLQSLKVNFMLIPVDTTACISEIFNFFLCVLVSDFLILSQWLCFVYFLFVSSLKPSGTRVNHKFLSF